MVKKKDVVHPIFLECAEFTLDFFWQQILTDIAYGKYPKGSGITNNILYVKNKGITETFALGQDPKKIFLLITQIFREKLGLSSLSDKKKKRIEINDNKKSSEMYSEKWSLVRKKAIKECLLHRFVGRLLSKYKLSIDKGSDIYSLIDLGFNFGTITSTDVIMKKGKILSIKGVVYDKKKKCVTVNYIPKENIQSDDHDKTTKINLVILWKKYYENIINKNKIFIDSMK